MDQIASLINPIRYLGDESLFRQGGPVMYPLLLVAVVGLACIIYCALALRRKVVIGPSLAAVAETLSADGDCAAAEAVCVREGGPFAEILSLVIRNRRLSREESEPLVEGAGRRAFHHMARGIMALEVVAAVAPLLGLLGTVAGMYNLLMKIRDVGANEIGLISGGIAEALITTMAGLVIAIPAYVAHAHFNRRIEDLTLVMEEYAARLMSRLGGGREKPEAAE